MYAIARVIYGIPLLTNNPDNDDKWSVDLSEQVDNEEDGFHNYYSGVVDYTPAAFGIELGSFDEACAFVDVQTLQLIPTAAQQLKYQQLWNGLDPTIQVEIATKFGSPRVFFLWTTS